MGVFFPPRTIRGGWFCFYLHVSKTRYSTELSQSFQSACISFSAPGATCSHSRIPAWPHTGHAHWAAFLSWGACSRVDKEGMYSCWEMQDFKSTFQSQLNLHSERRFHIEFLVKQRQMTPSSYWSKFIFAQVVIQNAGATPRPPLSFQASGSSPTGIPRAGWAGACCTPGLPWDGRHSLTELVHTMELGSSNTPKYKHNDHSSNHRYVIGPIFLWFSCDPKPERVLLISPYFAWLQRWNQSKIIES